LMEENRREIKKGGEELSSRVSSGVQFKILRAACHRGDEAHDPSTGLNRLLSSMLICGNADSLLT